MYSNLDDDQYSEHDEMDFSDPQDCNFNSDCYEDWSGERNDYDSDYDYQYLTFQEESCDDEFQDHHACDDFRDDFDCPYDGHDACSDHDSDQDWIDHDTYHTQDEYYDFQNEYYDSQCEQDSDDPCQHHYMHQPQHGFYEFDHDRFQPGSSDTEDREDASCDQVTSFQQPPQGQDAEQPPSSAPFVCTVFARPAMPRRSPSQHQPRLHLDHQRHQYSTRATNFPGTLSFGPTEFSQNARTDRRPESNCNDRQQRRQQGRERLREDPRQVRARQVSQQLHAHRQHQEQQQRDRRLAQKKQERQQEEEHRARQEHHLQQQLRLVQEQMLEQQRRQAQIEDQRASVAHRQAEEQYAAHYIAQMHAHAAYISSTYIHQQAFFAPAFPLGFALLPPPPPMPAFVPTMLTNMPAHVPVSAAVQLPSTTAPILEPACVPAPHATLDALITTSERVIEDKLCVHPLCIPDNIDNLV
eukprot:gene15779-18030_t